MTAMTGAQLVAGMLKKEGVRRLPLRAACMDILALYGQDKKVATEAIQEARDLYRRLHAEVTGTPLKP